MHLISSINYGKTHMYRDLLEDAVGMLDDIQIPEMHGFRQRCNMYLCMAYLKSETVQAINKGMQLAKSQVSVTIA